MTALLAFRRCSPVAVAVALVCAVAGASAAQPAPANSTDRFDLRNDMISDIAHFFDTGCSDASAYARIKGNLESKAHGADALGNQLLSPQRTKFEVIGTDLVSYETYYPSGCERSSRMKQCVGSTSLTAEQACDCTEGYIGDVRTGVGAGELIASANHVVGANACRIAADRTTGAERARYLAQLGRAQIYDGSGTFEGARTLQAAVTAGYGRAEGDLARAYIRDVEFGGQPPSELEKAMRHLAAARRAGERDTDAILKSMQEVAAVKRWNADFTRTWTRAMNQTPSVDQSTLNAQAAEDAARRRGDARPAPAPAPAPVTPIGGPGGLYGCAAPPCM